MGSSWRKGLRAAAAILALSAMLLLAACSQPAAQNAAEPSEQASENVSASADSQEGDGTATDALATPSTAGALQVVGSKLCDQAGNPVQLRGVSTHGLAWYPGYVNEAFFQELRQTWNANVVRLALYTAESGGYCAGGDREVLCDLVREGAGYANAADLYAIVDWHILSDGNPLQNADAAADFFSRMSADLSGLDNVIYEICNEPNGGTSWADIKAYAERIIPLIRANDPDAVVIVGTPTWSQEVDKAAASPLDAGNVMYALHFYAATHKDDLRNRMAAAVAGGLPVFISEFGICDASGNGTIDYDSANAWISAADELGVSYVCWNLSNKDEASALFKSSCDKTSGFTDDDLSAEGAWLRGVLQGEGAAGARQASAQAGGLEAASAGQPNAASASSQGASGQFSWSAKQVNSWDANGERYYQFSVDVANEGDAAADGWEVRLPFSAPISLSDAWNAQASLDGEDLVLASASYNSSLAPGATAHDVGFIVSSASQQLALGD